MQTTVTASRQSSFSLADGDVLRIEHPDPAGLPNHWRWELANWGPGALWVRWDGQVLAAVDGVGSLCLPAETAFRGIAAPMITVAANGATMIGLVADNTPSDGALAGFVPPRIELKPKPQASDPKEPEPQPVQEPEPAAPQPEPPEPEKEPEREPPRAQRGGRR